MEIGIFIPVREGLVLLWLHCTFATSRMQTEGENRNHCIKRDKYRLYVLAKIYVELYL